MAIMQAARLAPEPGEAVWGGALPGRALAGAALLVLAAGMLYGAAMGSYGAFTVSNGAESRWIGQMAFSAVKVPLLLLATFGIALPSFYVANAVAGLNSDFRRVLQILLATQGAMTLVLASFFPVTLFWYVSAEGYNAAILLNGLLFAVASFSAQLLVCRRLYEPLISKHPRHRWMYWGWLALYVFIGIQMGWTLRPFVGDPHRPTRFVRVEALSNAYVEVGRVLWSAVRGR